MAHLGHEIRKKLDGFTPQNALKQADSVGFFDNKPVKPDKDVAGDLDTGKTL